MSQVFISYAHVNPDQDIAAKLHRVIEANGFNVFVDSKIRLGQNWAEQIDLQLRSSTHFVALLSAASIKSDMVRREIAMAYTLKKANKLTILPVRLDFNGELPYELGAYLDLIQYVMWRPGESFDPICQAIVEAIRGSAPSNNIPPKSPDSKSFTERELEVVSMQLARYLGPVARVMVDRAAKQATNWKQLYDLLAAKIPEGEERRTFLASCPH